MRKGTLIVAFMGLAGCDSMMPAQYVPEVGYYQDGREMWWVGERYRSKDECVRLAAARFNAINGQSPRRAFSWACRVMKGDKFESRTRGE